VPETEDQAPGGSKISKEHDVGFRTEKEDERVCVGVSSIQIQC